MSFYMEIPENMGIQMLKTQLINAKKIANLYSTLLKLGGNFEKNYKKAWLEYNVIIFWLASFHTHTHTHIYNTMYRLDISISL